MADTKYKVEVGLVEWKSEVIESLTVLGALAHLMNKRELSPKEKAEVHKYLGKIDKVCNEGVWKDIRKQHFVQSDQEKETEEDEGNKIITDYCNDHTPFRGVCMNCGRY